MNENEIPSYFATISADVRYDKRLRANEKLLYGEITALCNKTGECWASNKYFSDLYGVTTQAVSKWITNLRQCGYISVNLLYKEGTKEIKRRIIKLSVASRNDVTSDCEVVTRDLGVVTNDCEGMVQKVKENNTSINNTSEYINIKESIWDNNAPQSENTVISDKPKRNKFVIPTEEELTEYAESIGFNNFEPKRFLYYYGSVNWMIGKKHMENWKMAVRTWQMNDTKKQTERKKLKNTLEGLPF